MTVSGEASEFQIEKKIEIGTRKPILKNCFDSEN